MPAGPCIRERDDAGHGADRWLVHAGARLRYRDSGRGPALLLLHGWTLDLEMWEPQAAALATQFRVLRLDRRGFGLSSGQPSVDADAADAQALLDHLGVGTAAIVGMSQGARAALRLAARAPERVTHLVLDGPPAEHASASEVPLAHYRALLRARGIAAVRHEWAQHSLMRLETRDAAAHALLARMLARYPGNDLREAPAAMQAAAAHAAARPAPALPVLVVTGALDQPARQAAADGWTARLPGARRARIAGAAHLPNLDAPDAYNALLREFLGWRAAGPHVPGEPA